MLPRTGPLTVLRSPVGLACPLSLLCRSASDSRDQACRSLCRSSDRISAMALYSELPRVTSPQHPGTTVIPHGDDPAANEDNRRDRALHRRRTRNRSRGEVSWNSMNAFNTHLSQTARRSPLPKSFVLSFGRSWSWRHGTLNDLCRVRLCPLPPPDPCRTI